MGKRKHNISKDVDYLNNTIKPPKSIGIHRMVHLKTAGHTAFEHMWNFYQEGAINQMNFKTEIL